MGYLTDINSPCDTADITLAYKVFDITAFYLIIILENNLIFKLIKTISYLMRL
jgi:hypothetical protein